LRELFLLSLWSGSFCIWDGLNGSLTDDWMQTAGGKERQDLQAHALRVYFYERRV